MEQPGFFLELAAWPKLSNRGRRASVREVTKNPMVILAELQILCGDGRNFQKDDHHYNTLDFMNEWPDLSERHRKSRLVVAKTHLVWSDKTKIKPFGLNTKCHVWRKPCTTHHLPNTVTVKYGSSGDKDCNRCQRCFN